MPFLFITSTYPVLSFIATLHWYIQLQKQAANCIIFSEEINTGAVSARVSNGKKAREEPFCCSAMPYSSENREGNA